MALGDHKGARTWAEGDVVAFAKLQKAPPCAWATGSLNKKRRTFKRDNRKEEWANDRKEEVNTYRKRCSTTLVIQEM